MNAGRRRDLPPPARNKAAVRLMRSINPEKNYKEIPKIVSIVLSIDPRAEVDILEWLKPVLGSIPWRSVDCRLLSFEHSPVGKWCIAMLHPATVSDFDRIVHVPYSTDDGDVSGQVAAAVYPGDAVSLPAHRDVWYTVYEIRADRNCVLIATAEADTLLNPAKVKSERKIWRNYMEVNTVHFLGCTVKREVIIGPLREVVDDWQPASDSTSELLRNQDCLYYRRIYFQIPKADPTSALKKLSTLSRSFTGAFENNLTGSTRPVHEKPGVSFVRKAKIIKQPKLFQQTQEETIVRSASRKQSRENPVESFQRLKHVQVWAARKVELSLAARALDTINPNPLLYTLDDTFNEFGDRSHLVDSLQLSRKRREVWLQVGRALRAVSRGTEGHILLSAWKQWTRRGISERAALTKKIQRARDLFGDAGEMVPASALETPDETACVAAWYSQRLPTNCDEGPIVEARSYLRRRIQELSKRTNYYLLSSTPYFKIVLVIR